MFIGTREVALREARGELLDAAKRRYLDASNADRRGGQHTTGVRWWVLFCVWGRECSPVPCPKRLAMDWAYAAQIEDLLEDFAVWLAVTRPSGRQVSAESIKKYVSQTRAWYRRFYRARLGLGAEGSRIADILKGYSREVQQPSPLEREGCRPQDLRAGMDAVLGDGSAGSAMWRACLTTAALGMMRGCEVALDDGRHESFTPEQCLVPADVSFVFDAAAVRHCRLRMRKRKDLRVLRGKHDSVLLAGGGRFLDAPAELARWLSRRHAIGLTGEHPLFCHPDGRAITVSELRTMVRRCMAAAGLDPTKFGAHSLRIGAATAALGEGVPPETIRLMGRWCSDAYHVYCRMSFQSALGVGAAIGSSCVLPTAPAFTEEHLELLPFEVATFRRAFGELAWDEMVEEAL